MKRSSRLALPLLAAGLSACADTPTTPAARAPVAAHGDAAAIDLRPGLADAADDAGNRVIPTLSESHGIQAAAAAFRNLGDAVRSGDAEEVRDAISQANGALNALSHAAPDTDPVEVAALRLVITNAELLYPAA
ncbi:MAG TPA: hypothetical protein VEX86_01855 [Longimicrobium sp.]|nr:hypothetical protein [Longimicrobium sp.]